MQVWELYGQQIELGATLSTADAVRRQAHRQPHALALADRHVAVTWAELDQLSDQWALSLLSQGYGRAETVAVQLPNSVALFAIRLALEKAGIRALTLPASYRRAEIGSVIARLRPHLALVSAEAETAAEWRVAAGPDLAVHEVAVEAPWCQGEAWPDPPAIAGHEFLLERTGFRPSERVQVVTTSGSTAKPKLVEESMAGRMVTGLEQARRFGVGADDRLCAASPLISGAPDALCYRAAPVIGCQVILCASAHPERVLELVRRHRATALILVPTILVRLVRLPQFAAEALPHLRLIVSYGAPLPADSAQVAEAKTGARLVQAYGSVDFGGIAATFADSPAWLRWHSVGPPLTGNQVEIWDEHGRPLPVGETGQVMVRGPHATAAYFADFPALKASWVRGFYRTGELGRFLDSGELVLSGRASEIIIRGGQNISPAEVEAWLRQHPAIEEAAVVGAPHPDLGETLVAFVSGPGAEQVTLSEMHQFLAELGVSRHKWPEAVMALPSLPLLPSGAKIDRAQLQRLAVAQGLGPRIGRVFDPIDKPPES